MLRFGVVVGPTLRAWELDCVRELEASGLAQPALVVRHGGIPYVTDTHPYDALAERCGARTQGTYGWLELARKTEAIVTVDPHIDAYGWIPDVHDANLDFLLLFGPSSIGAPIQNGARFGVWTFAHGDLTKYECSAPGFWELYYGKNLTAGFLLARCGSEKGSVALKSAHLATVRRSFRLNVDSICSLMAKWPALVCRNIEDGVADYFSGEPIPRPPVGFGWPNLLQTAAVGALQAQTRAQEYLRSRFFSIDWNVGVLDRSPSDFIGENARPKAKYLFQGNSRTYVADPCVVKRGSRTFLFCERYDHLTRRGFLVQTELVAGKAQPLTRIMDEKHHLSYPHVFEHGGETYCIPESRAARKVSLYRAVEFPKRWEFVRDLLDDFDAADSTLVSHGGKWWLFCTSSDLVDRGFNSNLYVWYADDLFGEWKPHVRNPLKMDARSARSAGPAFVHNGTLYRPVQDCGGSYGGSIHIARIDVLTERDFQETLVGSIRPPRGAYAKGVHTISAAGDVCVVDARRYAFSPWRIAFALRLMGQRLRLIRTAVSVPVSDSGGTAASLPTALDL